MATPVYGSALDLDEQRRYHGIRRLGREAVRLERTAPQAMTEAERQIHCRGAIDLLREAVDLTLDRSDASDAMDVVVLRRVSITKRNLGAIRRKIPEHLHALIFQMSAVLIPDVEATGISDWDLVRPFHELTHLVPRADSLASMFGPLAGSIPGGLATNRDQPAAVINNTALRAALWPARKLAAPLARSFLDSLAQLPAARGMVLVPISCPAVRDTYGVAMLIRRTPFQSPLGWSPAFRLIVLDTLGDLAWTVAYFLGRGPTEMVGFA